MPLYKDNEIYYPGLVFGAIRKPLETIQVGNFIGKADTFAFLFNPENNEISEHPLGWFWDGEKGHNFWCEQDNYKIQQLPEVCYYTNRFLAKLKIKEQIEDFRTPVIGKHMEAIKGKNRGKRGTVVKYISEWVFLKPQFGGPLFRVHQDHLRSWGRNIVEFREDVWTITSDRAETSEILLVTKIVSLYWDIISETIG